MADEILAGTGGTGTDVVAEALSRYIVQAAYGNRAILRTARIDTPDGAVIKRYRKNPVLTDAELTEVEEIANSPFVKSDADVETKRYGLATEMSDLNAMLGIQPLAEVGVEMGKAIGAGIETRLGALYAAFTAEQGATTVMMSVVTFLQAMLFIEESDLLDRGAIGCVLHPRNIAQLRFAISTEVGSAFGADSYGAASMTPIGDDWSLWGVLVKSSTKVPEANAQADFLGAMYPMGQLGPIVYQEQRAPRAVPVRGQSGERKSSTSLIATAFYGAGMIDDDGGTAIVAAQTVIPTP